MTNSRITKLDDISKKTHDFVMINEETGEEIENKGPLSAENIAVMEKVYKLMEGDKVPFDAA